ncbi:MAG TPA: toll/interleukin-1 receptor domain-containing protein [Ktedonobacterales bacterium]|jgi:uncharacterized protein YjbI with pentapeptide repeats
MANEEHLAIIKQGVEVWNKWREIPKRYPNLSGADLSGADLRGAWLAQTNLSGANLSGANLGVADLWRTDLTDADLSHVNLTETAVTGTGLKAANLSRAILTGTRFTRSDLSQTKWQEAIMSYVIFGDVDLTQAQDLETVIHDGPSTIGIDTIYRSQGQIPEVFLRGTGVPDSFIDYMCSLTGKPIDYYSAFISYSSKDDEFAKRLYNDLQGAGVRCWFAPEDLKIGDETRTRIDESIRLHDKLLLILSEHSIASAWVQKEVETAFEKERQQKRLMLFPIRLDYTVMNTPTAWAADIRRMRNIGDFTRWKDHDAYQKAFERLLRDLKAASTTT